VSAGRRLRDSPPPFTGAPPGAAEAEAAPTGSGASPSLGVIVTVFQRSRFYREALRSVAAQTGPLPDVELVVVRSADVEVDVPEPLMARGWPCTVVRSEAIGEGPFLADGLAALRSEFVLPLDDDDLWTPQRLSRVAAALAREPNVGYYHNGQQFVDAEGVSLDPNAALRRLRRFAGVPSGPPRVVSQSELRSRPSRLASLGSLFNNSSVAIRRSSLVECADELRATTRLIDSFMFYVGASSGAPLCFDPSPTTQYRIHAWNRSRGPRMLGPFEVPQSSHTREGRLSSVEAMRRVAARRNAPWLLEWVEHDRAYFDVLEGLREGDPSRVRTARRAARLARYASYADPIMNVLMTVTACGQVVAPSLVHRWYWGGDLPKASVPAVAPGR
jgi:hypothetical protein